MTKKKYGKYILIYTLLFAAVFLAVFFPYLSEGKNLIGKGDGESQYILQLRYMGEWLRETFAGFLQGNLQPRRFDFTIGMGDDIGAVVRFHPLDLLSVFVPGENTEGLYSLLTVLRCYLAGLSLSAYTFHFGKSFRAALSGALCYVFCGFTFGLGIVHPTYMSHMILFPMLMLGAEYMMDPERKHSPALFIISAALGFISNYYFMYISSFGLLAYVLIRFFAIYREDRLKNFFRLLVSMILAYLTGLCISAVFLLPALLRYGSSLRAVHDTEKNSLLFYKDKRRYLAWFLNMITPLQASGNGTHLNYSVTLLPAVTLAAAAERRRKEARQLRAGLFLLLLCLLLPGLGYVLAAMNNENNRWVYLIAFAAAVSVGFTADLMGSMSRKERKLVFLVTAVFDLGCAGWFFLTRNAVYHLAAAIEVTVYAAVMILMSRKTASQKQEEPGGRDRTAAEEGTASAGRSERAVLIFTAFSVVIAGFMTFSPRFGNLVTYYQEQGTAFSRYERSAYSVYNTAMEKESGKDRLFEDGFYRVDGVRKNSWEDNSSLLLGYPGIQIYNSIVNASELNMMKESQNIGMTSILHIQSLDGRTVPEELAGVKYFASDRSNAASMPYGYSSSALASVRKYSLYENENPLPFGFTVDTVISGSDLEKLSVGGADLALLSAASVEKPQDAGKDEAETFRVPEGLKETDGKEFEEQVLKEDGTFVPGPELTEKDGTLHAEGRDGYLRADFSRKPGYECYLQFQGLKLLGGTALGGAVGVSAKGIDKEVYLALANNSYGRGSDDYTVNLGYTPADQKENTESLQIVIPKGYTILLQKIRFLYIPMAGYEEKVSRLGDHALENVRFGKDEVSGTVKLDQPAYMIFQIPYGKSWTAVVNGKKVVPDRADRCYLGLPLGKGESEIRLIYRSPGVRSGGILSLAGLLVFAVLCYNEKKRKEK